jgi:hypothetical protein
MPSWFGRRLETHDKRLSPFAQGANDAPATARPNFQTRLKRIVSHESDATATNKSAKRPRNQLKSNLVAGMAEFVGTFMFLFFAFAGNQIGRAITSQTANEYDPSVLILISLCFGFSLMANAWAFYRVSGGLFNPAVSLHHAASCEKEVRDTEYMERSPSHSTSSEAWRQSAPS